MSNRDRLVEVASGEDGARPGWPRCRAGRLPGFLCRTALPLVLLLTVTAPGQAQESRGSAVPCAVPMGWWIAEVDPRFGLTEAEAGEAVEAAARLWEEAAGRPLFHRDPDGPLPVAFRYDERQATYVERREAQDELERLGRELDSIRADVEARQADLRRQREDHGARVQSLLERMDAYNREVAAWNRQGGAPDTARARLDQRAAVLAGEQRALQRQGDGLTELERSLSEEVRRLNARIEERNQLARDLTRRYSGQLTEAGRYDEQVETGMREVRVRSRQIGIFRFEDRDDLVGVLAHELGHALGLGHTEAEGAVMNTVIGTPPQGTLHPADLRLLLARCPMFR